MSENDCGKWKWVAARASMEHGMRETVRHKRQERAKYEGVPIPKLPPSVRGLDRQLPECPTAPWGLRRRAGCRGQCPMLGWPQE